MMKRLFYSFIAALLLIAGSCSDESYSTSRNDKLLFSVDTLKMDTVFSGVPSSTYSFKVYNHNDNSLRISQVRLSRGSQSGFRVNVDGVYLDNMNGSQAQNFDIRKGDSLLVLVELTSHSTNQTEPQAVEDKLLFTLESGVEQSVSLLACSWDAVSLRNLVVSNDTTISSSKPIIIYGGIKVDSGAVLTIKSPASLYFHASAGIDVFGRLIVKGQQDDEVVMRGDRLDRMFDYLPYDRVSGQWRGIRFHSSSTANCIDYADIHSAEDGLVCDSAEIDPSVLRLDLAHTTIHNCKGYGLKADNSRVSLVNCQLTNTLDDCLSVTGGETDIIYCTLAQFYPFSADRGVALRFGNYENAVQRGTLMCQNSVVTGYSDDVVMGDSLAFDYHFVNSVLRTPAVSDSVLLKSRFENVVFETSKDSINGDMHFVAVDLDLQYYDFYPDTLSTLRLQAIPLEAIRDDREGRKRGDQPTIGCFE
ncbi:MAG: right-handed parallel beta-helix repeat-containing protein [Prevotella sp.]|nr:right-handed parallel beta-helix repeat-containing protein [Prevotella sp.]